MTSQNQTTRFADLPSGGRALAAALDRYDGLAGAIVLGIVRAGAPVAYEVAAAFGLPLDLILLRALFQRPSGDPVRAASVSGTLVLDDELEARSDHPPLSVEDLFAAEAIDALVQRERECRGGRGAVGIEGRVVILVDSGMRTGGTMLASVRAVRRLRPSRIIAATPVSSRDALARVQRLAAGGDVPAKGAELGPDEVINLSTPAPYGHVAMGYDRYVPMEEGEIHSLLDRVDASSGTQRS
jgi:predicted phosphoribosyltransferase